MYVLLKKFYHLRITNFIHSLNTYQATPKYKKFVSYKGFKDKLRYNHCPQRAYYLGGKFKKVHNDFDTCHKAVKK